MMNATPKVSTRRGSILVVVMWIAFGIVSLAVLFGQSAWMALRASDAGAAGAQSRQIIDGAARYIAFVLENLETPGTMPDEDDFEIEATPVGDGFFWLIGEPSDEGGLREEGEPTYGLVDEASKLNLNTASREMLEALPEMTVELAASIIDWRDGNDNPVDNGSESDFYLLLTPSYEAKNAPFESIEELKLVYGGDDELLYGEDANLNGLLDANEDDGDATWPDDNADGRLDRGLLAYLTVHSREPNKQADGSERVNMANNQNRNQLRQVLVDELGGTRGTEVFNQAISAAPLNSLLKLIEVAELTSDEAAKISDKLTTTDDDAIVGRINAATASAEVLACVPGIDEGEAESLVSSRLARAEDELTNLAWVAEVLDRDSAFEAGLFLTASTYTYRADIAAVGRHGRGFRRARITFDVSDGTARIVARRELTRAGWPLGGAIREALNDLAQENAR